MGAAIFVLSCDRSCATHGERITVISQSVHMCWDMLYADWWSSMNMSLYQNMYKSHWFKAVLGISLHVTVILDCGNNSVGAS